MIDGHCHLDSSLKNVENSFKTLYDAAVSSQVSGIILLNIEDQGYRNDDVLLNAKKYENFFHVFPGINPLKETGSKQVEKFKNRAAKGIKLHPRLHNYQIECAQCLDTLKSAGDCNLPVMIDCFPDGKNIILGNTPEAFGRVAKILPYTKIIIGHSGGHRILDALMIAKECKNIYLDLSFSLLYYRQLPILPQINYVIKNMKGERIIWGTDFPDRAYDESVSLSLKEFNNINLSESERTNVLIRNACNLTGIDFEKRR